MYLWTTFHRRKHREHCEATSDVAVANILLPITYGVALSLGPRRGDRAVYPWAMGAVTEIHDILVYE